jgi:YidC/Oxa1 family membrane protein insertase
MYKHGDSNIKTDDLEFKVVKQTADEITLESNRKGKTVGFTYKLKQDKYDLDYNVYFKGFTDEEVSKASFTADMYLLSTEKHFPTEERQGIIYWQYKGDDYDYITNDSYEMEEIADWICFRSTFFTAILSNKTGFGKENSTLAIETMKDEEQTKYIKQYTANMNLGATTASNSVELNWYFGPVDYDVLVEYNNGTEDIVELGTGLFRWINKYAIRPLFNGMLGMGMGLGLAIFLLTVIVKLILSPVNYKMYKSSAMMKVLKPEIEKISQKYPKKEDAMKKQQETMALYRETGVSPLAGCVPMLIQMPILFAIFRLFPSSIELRQKSFLWAEDLSSYDSPIVFGFDIPLYGDHVSIFTLLMAITTLLYTHYNSSNMQQPTQEGMPNLKYIMYFFPIMMIFFFNSYSSGLSFYYFISTLMTIGIMFGIKKFFIDEEKILAKIEAKRANPKKKGKSKFQQRLEEAQKLQQEKNKNRKK